MFLMWSAFKFDSEGSTDEFVFLCQIALSNVFAVFYIKMCSVSLPSFLLDPHVANE